MQFTPTTCVSCSRELANDEAPAGLTGQTTEDGQLLVLRKDCAGPNATEADIQDGLRVAQERYLRKRLPQ
jgi:hypothetical protein